MSCRTALILLTLLAPAVVSFAGDDVPPTYFEGEVEYQISVESRHPKLPVERLRSQYGTHFTTIFKNGRYMETHKEGLVAKVWFDPSENKEYTQMRGEDFIRVADGHDLLPTPTKVEAVSRTREILGYRASALVVHFDDGSRTTFWYSSELRVDPAWFSRFRLAGFHLYYPRAKAMILEYDREMDILRRTFTVTKVKRRKVSDAEIRLLDLPIKPFDYEAPK